jgi:hypothetical protein
MTTERYSIGWHTDSDSGRVQPTGAKTRATAIRAAKRLARREAPAWTHRGYGPYWRVYDAATGEELASGRV